MSVEPLAPHLPELSLDHPCLRPGRGMPLGGSRLDDRRGVAVLLQGACLLAHLRQAGGRLAAGWAAGTVDGEGRLQSLAAEPGADSLATGERLRELVALLFGPGRVAGRGEARRAVRSLLAGWPEEGDGLDPDRAVDQVLGQAPFLWAGPFAAPRQGLAALHGGPERADVWVCGPGPARRRLLAAAPDLARLRDLLAGPRARLLWTGEEGAGDDPPALAGRRRFRAAVEAFVRLPPRNAEERLALARCQAALGRWESAWQLVQRSTAVPARLLALRCAIYLHRLHAARQRLARLDDAALDAPSTLVAAELAVRLLAQVDQADRAAGWVARARAAGAADPLLAAGAELLAAEAAWDRGEPAAMEECLAAATTLRDHAQHAWRWHQVRGLQAMAAGDGDGVVAAAAAALATSRRWLEPVQAAALWNDLAVGRVQQGDLAGAERACAHQARLLAGGEGVRRELLALRNLAEVRLRRGRTAGVRELLERAIAANRQEGNLRAATQDGALWARWELVHGRPLAALAACRETLAALDAAGSDWHRGELAVFAARALGWLERPEEARRMLAELPAEALTALEPEELPALFAHAGEREEALAHASGPAAALWRAALTGGAAASWAEVEALEPFRRARLVWDLELAAPGAAGPERIREAIAVLRRTGAGALAERLEERLGGAWEAVAAFLARPDPGDDDLHRLFAAAGAADARLLWRDPEGDERTLLDGPGGEAEQTAPWGGGALVLHAARLDPALKALFQLVRRHLAPPAAPPGESGALPGFIGDSPELRRALASLPLLAAGEMPVLVLGESGTGKELVARQIHRLSPRREGPFLAMNCAAVSENLLLSDLFGHVRGAFTGADRDRPGIFESARGGTVFLDEIGDLPLAAQGMLLRVLQEKEIRRVGESLPRKVDVRVVAATHRGLAAMVDEGGFRRDLYYRLKVAVIDLPPLRERGRDVLRLAEHFLRRRRGGGAEGLTREAGERLLRHDWPGNVRELENVLEVAMALAADGTVGVEHLGLPAEGEEVALGDYHQAVEAFRRRLVEQALAAAGGRQAEAARRLGVTRQALSYLVRQLRIG